MSTVRASRVSQRVVVLRDHDFDQLFVLHKHPKSGHTDKTPGTRRFLLRFVSLMHEAK